MRPHPQHADLLHPAPQGVSCEPQEGKAKRVIPTPTVSGLGGGAEGAFVTM